MPLEKKTLSKDEVKAFLIHVCSVTNPKLVLHIFHEIAAEQRYYHEASSRDISQPGNTTNADIGMKWHQTSYWLLKARNDAPEEF